MARPYDYSRTRYVAMQLSMWVILAGTVAVAAVVTKVKRNSDVIELGDPRPLQTVTVRLPVDWRVANVPGGYVVSERAGGVQRRELAVIERSNGGFTRWLGDALGPPASRVLRDSISMGGTMAEVTEHRERFASPELDFELVRIRLQASGRLSNGNVIEVSLTSVTPEGAEDPQDIEIVKLIASTIAEPQKQRLPEMRR